MGQARKTFKAIPQATLRRLRNTPGYIFILWRWVAWLYALIWLISIHAQPNPNLAILLLGITLLQTLVVTLYAPVFQIFLPGLPGMRKAHRRGQQQQQRRIWGRRRPRPLAADEEADIRTPFASTRNPYWDIGIYGLDVVICGLVTYYGGLFGSPHFGDGSPFYRFGISTALAAAFTYRYRGGLAAALGYEFFILLGAFFPPPGAHPFPLNAIDLGGSLIDAPLVAIIAAYLATLLESYTRSKRREQDNARNQRALRRVGETLVEGASDRQHLLQRSAEEIRKGGHFERLVIGLLSNAADEEDSKSSQPQIETSVESSIAEAASSLERNVVAPLAGARPTAVSSDETRTLLEQVTQSREKLITFEPPHEEESEDAHGIARLYLPLFKEGQVYMVLGAESRRSTPFEEKQLEFLSIAGAQLLVALENMRLTEQTAELAAAAERGRIAREIHDGVAQLTYMLSLNAETCAALAHRIADTFEDEEQIFIPLTERLDKQVTISKEALWETRHYMFTLKPLIRGTSTLTEMLTNQLREFEAISGLPVRLEVEGSEEMPNGDRRRTHKTAQAGTAIFRITQEALTNAYKYAEATQIQVHLRHLQRYVEVEICDNGKGLDPTLDDHDPMAKAERQRIYSGHGMGGMRERAEELGGSFEVTRVPTGGLSVRARIPT